MVLEETGSTLEKLVAWLTPLLGQHYAASDGILVILLYRLITLTQLPATTKKQTGMSSPEESVKLCYFRCTEASHSFIFNKICIFKST